MEIGQGKNKGSTETSEEAASQNCYKYCFKTKGDVFLHDPSLKTGKAYQWLSMVPINLVKDGAEVK